jgi:16S rRNA (adenine1518-N6/adenine1519-N6)-dimethyltransferase
VAAIVEAVGNNVRPGIVEIGSGLGALTLPLSERADRLAAVEIDRRLATRLREALAPRGASVEVVGGDILEFDFAAMSHAWGGRIVVVGSIPYSITAPILKKLISERAAIRVAYLITQREVAEKMLASPGKDGTALGVLVRAYGDVEILRWIARGAFYPIPEVDSCLWRLTMLERPQFASGAESFFAVVRAIYGARRKTLRNALQRQFPRESVDAIVAAAGLDGGVRGETLGFAELDALANAAGEALSALG